jgi:hypothetical protein
MNKSTLHFEAEGKTLNKDKDSHILFDLYSPKMEINWTKATEPNKEEFDSRTHGWNALPQQFDIYSSSDLD